MSDRRLALETAAANALREALLTITDDEDAVRDTIEGETNLREAIAIVLADIGEDEILVEGIGAMMKKLAERKGRIEYRIDRRRAAIERAMVVGEIQKLELPLATLSLRKVAPGLEITDEKMIPECYFVAQPPKLDKVALKDDLKAGKQLPGAILGNGSINLTIRRA